MVRVNLLFLPKSVYNYALYFRTLFPPDKPEYTRRLFERADVDPSTRPMQLDITEFDRMAQEYKNICDELPGMLEYDYRSQENAKIWREKSPSSLGIWD